MLVLIPCVWDHHTECITDSTIRISPTKMKPWILWLILSSFLNKYPDSFVLLVRELSVCGQVLISPLVMFMYKQQIPVGETGMQSRIWAQHCSWKVRRRWQERGGVKREVEKKDTQSQKMIRRLTILNTRSGREWRQGRTRSKRSWVEDIWGGRKGELERNRE